MANSDQTILAIDFGTSNSLVGAFHHGNSPQALPIDENSVDPTLMRTLLYFPNKNTCFYGSLAIAKYLEHEMEGRLFRSFKTHLPNKNYMGTLIEDRILPLEQMVGIFLLELKKRAEKVLGCSVKKAVIGKPARYSMDPVADSLALHRMEKAVQFAGFESYRFVPEPLAAAFSFRKSLNSEKVVLVGDFGGGTSDFTLIRLSPNEFQKGDVLAIEGCPLAGDALDSLFMSRRLNEFFGASAKYKASLGRNILTMPAPLVERLNQPAHIVHLKEKATYEFIHEMRRGALDDKTKQALDRLFVMIEDQQIFNFFEAIEGVKRELSYQNSSQFQFAYPDIDVEQTFSRNEFETWATTVQHKIFSSLDSCLAMAGLNAEQVDLVFLTGGSSQVPLIRAELSKRFGEHKLQTQAHFHSIVSGLVEGAAQWANEE